LKGFATVNREDAENIPAGNRKIPVIWNFKLNKPGLYGGSFQLIENDKIIRSSGFCVLYASEKLKAPPPPADYDAFWKRTMDKLAKVPIEFTRQSTSEKNNYIFSRIEFKSVDGKPAWGNLAEPKAEGKYPAILKLPPVSTNAPGYNPKTDRGFVVLGCEVYGYDPHWSAEKKRQHAKAGGVQYQPFEASIAERPEDFWIYYACCTISRAYDILANHPKVDRNRIYITGVSQGGGLALAAAGLRPQNAGALPIVPGLARIDWRIYNRGAAWGPYPPKGEHFDEMAKMLMYFETAYLMKNIRSRMVMWVGLFDDHTPPHAAASVFYHTPENLKERKLLVGPWTGHGGNSELDKIIPRWAKEDER